MVLLVFDVFLFTDVWKIWRVGEVLPPFWMHQWNYFEVVGGTTFKTVGLQLHTYTPMITHSDKLRIIWEKNNTCEISHRVKVHRTNSQDKREGVFTVISTLAKELLKIRERPVTVHYHIRIIRISHFEKKWPLREAEKRWKVRVSPTFIYAQSNEHDHTHTHTQMLVRSNMVHTIKTTVWMTICMYDHPCACRHTCMHLYGIGIPRHMRTYMHRYIDC